MERETRHTSLPAGGLRTRRGAGGAGGITGTAIVFNVPARIGSFDEVIRPEAVEGVLGAPIVALFNHDANLVLGRSPKTMQLRTSSQGLVYDIPSLPKARADVLEAVERGDVTGNSFSFTVPGDGSGERWIRPGDRKDGGTRPLREILRLAAIYDVGPVTFPAYESTQVSARAQERASRFDVTPPSPGKRAPSGTTVFARERPRLAAAEADCTGRRIGPKDMARERRLLRRALVAPRKPVKPRGSVPARTPPPPAPAGPPLRDPGYS